MLGISKALAAAVVAFLAPIGAFLALTGDWSWRAFAASVVSGGVGGFATYATPTDPAALTPARSHRHEF